MSDTRASDGKYHVEIRDARGVVIGDKNIVYQYFLDERYRPLAEHLIAFDDLITERTADFVGRAFLDARLAAFMAQHDRGYFVLVGEPGIGKTAWAAHVVREHQALHHFNVSAMGIVRPDQALENLCAQIIARFQLDQPYLPINAGRDGSLLDRLLRQAAERLDGNKLVIVIDALDEAQMPADIRGANALYLPTSLPAGVYFVLTRRPQPMPLDTAPGTASETFALGAELPNNQADVRAYLRQQACRPAFVARLTDRRIPTERFVEELAERSAGNFMYLAYLLPDIAVGAFDPLNLNGLPAGLRGYYERFWNELEAAKGEGREAWTKFYKPVIGMLAAAREPVSAAWIGRILCLDPDEVADFALARWCKFLYRVDVAGQALWRLYHASFGDFLADKLDGVKRYHGQIADYYRLICNGDWPRLMETDKGYGLRHLAPHLAGAERWEELHSQVAEGHGDFQLWAQARHELDGSYEGYLADLEILWSYAEGLMVTSPEAVISHQVRYVIIEASIRSLAGHLSPGLLTALLSSGMPGWTSDSALAYALQIPFDMQKAHALAGLAPFLTRDSIQKVLSAARSIDDSQSRAHLLASLVPFLPSVLQPKVAEEALAALRASPSYQVREYSQIISLVTLLPYIIDGLLEDALTVADSLMRPFPHGPNPGDVARRLVDNVPPYLLADAFVMDFKDAHDLALSILAPWWEMKPLSEAFGSPWRMGAEYARDRLEILLAPYMSLDKRANAVVRLQNRCASGSISRRTGSLLSAAIKGLPHPVADSMLESVQPPNMDVFDAAIALWTLAPHLPAQLLGRALEMARMLPPLSMNVPFNPQAEAVCALLPYLPTELYPMALGPYPFDDSGAMQYNVLTALAPHLRDNHYARSWAIRKSLASLLGPDELSGLMNGAADSVDWRETMVEVSALVASSFPPDARRQTLAEALAAASAISDEEALASTLGTIALSLSSEHIGDVLGALQRLPVMRLTNDAFSVLTTTFLLPHFAPRLRDTILRDALFKASQLRNPTTRALTLNALCGFLPADEQIHVRNLAVMAARAVPSPSDRARVLITLAPGLSPAQMAEALRAVRALPETDPEGSPRGRGFAVLAPLLPPELLPEALMAATAIRDPSARILALRSLSPYIPVDLGQTTQNEGHKIEAVTAQDDASGGRSISEDGENHDAFVMTISSAFSQLRDQSGSGALDSLVRNWLEVAQKDRALACECWNYTLRLLRQHSRRDALFALRKMAPVILALGGEAGIWSMAQAIIDVSHWWP